jgi:membrane-bound lytic murein transglycosylase B
VEEERRAEPIRGIHLDGRAGVALVRDTDGGKLDGDPNFDRAVGPMQFIPSTWAVSGVDGNGDGMKDPNNIFDAALATAHFLCAGSGDMTNPAQETAAVRRYNDADEYVPRPEQVWFNFADVAASCRYWEVSCFGSLRCWAAASCARTCPASGVPSSVNSSRACCQ